MPTASDPSFESNGVPLKTPGDASATHPGRTRRWVIWLIMVGIVLAGLSAYLLASKPSNGDVASAAVYVPTTTVRTGPLERTLRVAGQTSARNFAAIVVPILRGQPGMGGRGNLTLTKLTVGGTKVKKGDEVAALDNENITNQLDDLRANIEQAELDLGKLKAQQALDWLTVEQTVRSAKATSDRSTLDYSAADVKTTIEQELLKLQMEQDADSYKQQQLALPLKKVSQVASFRMSEIALQLQKNTYAKTLNDLKTFTFRAPMDGLVVLQSYFRSGGNQAQYQVGDTVGAGQTFMKIVDTSTMQLEGYASQSESNEIRVGQTAKITLDAFPGLVFSGKVYSLGAKATQGMLENYYVRTVSVLVRIQGNDARLFPDLSGAAELLLARKENVTQVPLECIWPEGGKFFVYRRTLNGFEKRYVQVGLRSSTQAEIVSGLREGDQVALSKPPSKP